MTMHLPSYRGPRMVCIGCGCIGADARPNCQEQPSQESLAGPQWTMSGLEVSTKRGVMGGGVT